MSNTSSHSDGLFLKTRTIFFEVSTKEEKITYLKLMEKNMVTEALDFIVKIVGEYLLGGVNNND